MRDYSRGLVSKAASRVPGDPLRELIKPASDIEGNYYPQGTKFTPISGGYDNHLLGTVQTVLIDNNMRKFVFRNNAQEKEYRQVQQRRMWT